MSTDQVLQESPLFDALADVEAAGMERANAIAFSAATLEEANEAFARAAERALRQGASLRDISDAAGLHHSTVADWLDRHGVSRRRRVPATPA